MKDSYILIVEDDSRDEILIRRSFEKVKLANELVFVHDGVEALEFLYGTGSYSDRDPNDLPQVVMLDLNIPKVSGLEVLERIRENDLTKTLPVVVLTSSDEQEDKLRSYSLGANSYVRKPIEFGQFTESVAKLGMYWCLMNEPPPSK